MPNQRVNMDLYGPQKTSRSGKSKSWAIDPLSKYFEMVAIPDKTTTMVASAIFSRWLCRHGLPLNIVSDGGKEFCNQVVNEILKLMPIKNHYIPLPSPN
jgi:hypothetical protein